MEKYASSWTMPAMTRGYPREPGDVDGEVGPLVGVDPAEEEQVVGRRRDEGEPARSIPWWIDGSIVQVGVAVGITDRDVVSDVIV